MIKASITISNKLGLHARASAKLTKLAGSFQSDVFMTRKGPNQIIPTCSRLESRMDFKL